ncbi:telomeric repeat-binding factor 1 isoform X1 [Pristis pectinata]|uniref:telomeric repeat-binding factor 1 isoform X1 n=1 Tax=Pristis pectinata TaxID=685728 RepID=UPI00223DB6F3|nr:telomeric repeat-binding factor 1 isoform X1 [Pristis pectinata]
MYASSPIQKKLKTPSPPYAETGGGPMLVQRGGRRTYFGAAQGKMEACGGKKVQKGLPVGVDFFQVMEVANGWIVDFMCYSLYRYFGAGMFEEFRMMRDAMNGFVQQPSIIESNEAKKVHICQILSRIVEGDNLDVQFDKDESITPLESALMVLNEMVGNSELQEDALFADLKRLLQIQSVAVCIDKGDFKKATEVLERQFQENITSESDQSLRRKLSLIITKKDPYHKFLNNFSNERLVECAESLASRMISEKNSNFLFQAAHKVVESKMKGDANLNSSGDESNHEHQEDKCGDLLRDIDGELNNTEFNIKRSKKQLYSFSLHKEWKPIKSEANKNFLGKRKKSSGREKRVTCSGHLVKIKKQSMSTNSGVPRKKRPWLWEEDVQLKEGVRKFGPGNWTKFGGHYEFHQSY